MSWITDLFDSAVEGFNRVVSDIFEQIWRDWNNFVDQLVRTTNAIIDFVVDYWMYIVLVIVLVVAWYYSPYYISAMSAYEVGGGLTYAAVATYASSLYLYFLSVLEYIHFATLLKLHTLAFIVSSEYREMIAGIYQQIGTLSLAIGLGAESMYLFYQNARSLVLDASTAMGMSFDLAEINWLRSFADYTKEVKDKMQEYRGNPALFLQDIAILLEKPWQDAKASFTQAILSTIDGSLKVVRDAAELLTTLNNDVKRLASDLPASIKEHVKPLTDSITNRVDDFIQLNYNPAIKMISGVLNVLQEDQAVAKRQIRSTVDRLSRPGRYLREIKLLPLAERIEDEADVAELAASGPSRTAEELRGLADASRAITYADIEEGIPVYEPSPKSLPVIKRESPPGESPAPKITTPFVGEY